MSHISTVVKEIKLIPFKSIILEKGHDITQDPRGVVLTGDALRSLWTLGLGKHVSSIGHGRCYISTFSRFQNQ